MEITSPVHWLLEIALFIPLLTFPGPQVLTHTPWQSIKQICTCISATSGRASGDLLIQNNDTKNYVTANEAIAEAYAL